MQLKLKVRMDESETESECETESETECSWYHSSKLSIWQINLFVQFCV